MPSPLADWQRAAAARGLLLLPPGDFATGKGVACGSAVVHSQRAVSLRWLQLLLCSLRDVPALPVGLPTSDFVRILVAPTTRGSPGASSGGRALWELIPAEHTGARVGWSTWPTSKKYVPQLAGQPPLPPPP